MKNWNCDGSGPHSGEEVRLYPLGDGANLILCKNCVAHENEYRRQRAVEDRDSTRWPQQPWATLEKYPQEVV